MKRRLFCVLLTMVTGAVCCVAQPPHLVFRNLNMSQGIERILETIPQSPERDLIVEFVKSSPRGVIKGV